MGRSPRRPKAFARHAPRYCTAYAGVYSVATHAAPACMLPPLRYTAHCCAGDATSPHACACTRCTRGALRPCGVAHHVHAVQCTSLRSLCLRTGTCRACTRAPCALVATLPRARMRRPLACSLHECLHANGVSLLATDTQACCCPPAGGQQHACVEPLEVRRSTSMHRYPLSMCMLWSTLLLFHLPPLPSAHLDLPVTWIWSSSGSSPSSRCLAGPKLEVNRGYAIPYYISRARAGRRPTAGLEKKKGSRSGYLGLLRAPNSPFYPKSAQYDPILVPFLAPFCPCPEPHYPGDVEHMHMVCISPRIPPLRG